MKKTKLTRSLLAACSIVALSVVLSGCLHSGDDATTTTPETPTVDGNLTLAGVTGGMAVMPGTYSVDAALAAAFADAEGLAGVDHAMGAMVMVGDVNLTCAVGPCRVTVNDDDTVTVTGTIHTADYTPPDPPPSAEEIASEGKRITAAIGSTPVVADADPSSTGTIEVPYTADGSKMLTTTLALDGTTTTVPRAEMFALSDDSPAAIDGWAGSMYTRMRADDADTEDTDEFLMDTVVSYTNEEAGTEEDYATWFSTSDAGSRDGVASATAAGVLTLSGDQTGNHGLFSTAFGITAPHQTVPITHAQGETETEFDGMFTGVPGTFTCSGTCSVASDSDGNLITLTGTWEFTPTMAQGVELADIMVPGVIRDDDYLTFGYWLRATNDEDGALQYAFRAFAQGMPATADISSVTDTASYSGAATGLFVRNEFKSDGSSTPVGAGQFTAEASLDASFGGGNVATNDAFSITGMISNFRDMDGDTIDENWTVMLMRPDADDNDILDSNITESAGTFSGVTTGEGAFAGQFHGTDDAATTDVNEKPVGVSGTFDGHFSNGSVRGAFGATLDEE